MKIETIEDEFQPITITLETKDEFLQFYAFFEEHESSNLISSEVRIELRRFADSMQ